MTDSRGATLAYTYESTISYDIESQIKKSETDCNKNSLRYEYDDWNRLVKIWTSYDTATTPSVSYEYHSVPLPASNDDALENVEITKLSYTWYTITNNKVSFDTDDKNVIQTIIEIDGLGRVVRSAKTGFVNGTLGWNISGAVEYDAKGRIVKQGMTEFFEGSLSDLLSTSASLPSIFTSYVYDEKDRKVKTILPDSSLHQVDFKIENKNLIAKSTDPLKNITRTFYDEQGNIIKLEKYDSDENLLTKLTYAYNSIGEMIQALDAAENPISAEYDLLGRCTALESLDSGRQEFVYDECSNLIEESNSVLREKAQKIYYEYDGLNRLTKIDYPETEDTFYTYGGADNLNGAAGKILKLEDASGTLEYEYGRLGEVTKETRTLATHLNGSCPTEKAVMEYRSDYLGRMQYIIYPDGEKISYGYDSGGQVICVSGEHFGHKFYYVTNILYDEYGQRTKIDYGNGVSTTYEYDSARRWLSNVKSANKWDKQFQNITYSFDTAGNVLGYTNDCLTNSSGNYSTSQTYSYDALYQLTGVKGTTLSNEFNSPECDYISNYSQTFTFDSEGLGNMISKISSEKTSPQKFIGDDLNYTFVYNYDENYAHRLVNIGNRYYKYDANGNVICEKDGPFDDETSQYSYTVIQEAEDVYSTNYAWGYYKEDTGSTSSVKTYQRVYTWNERNLLISSVDSRFSTAYVYGQDGQRSNKYTASSETLYFNRMWTLHTDSGNALYGGQSAKNIYLGETRIVTKLNSGNNPTYQEEYYKQYYYHSDHLGSASLISDYKGDEYQRIEYTPYGETWVEKTQNTGLEYLPYRFTGKEIDEETGLYYYGARYLDPKYSRWISTDPALEEYIPVAPVSDETRQHNSNLSGMGGVFNHINGNLYHYAGNNPVRYVDPDGNAEKKPTALLGQKAHRTFFIAMDVAMKAEDPTSIKIFDSRLINIKDAIGVAFKPNRNPDLDEIPSPNTRPDAVNIKMGSTGNTVEVLELKPISCSSGYKHQKAVAQLEGYKNKMKSYFPDVNVEGGDIDSICNVPIPFPAAGDKATITFIPDATIKGLYYYKIDDGE